MGLHQEKFPLLATTLQAAAGVSGPQKWALILPSSARVSLVTYTAVIAVRYPELDNVQNDLICFGNYLLGEQATSGGFLPLFWDAPSAYMHAATDIGSAVDWLQSQVEIWERVSCCSAQSKQDGRRLWQLGMTAHYVLLAQTKVGFLSGGRGRHMKELSECSAWRSLCPRDSSTHTSPKAVHHYGPPLFFFVHSRASDQALSVIDV